MEIENNEIKYRVPENGIINTSSPREFGWVNNKHSGSYQLKAFYVDESGDKVKELPQEEIRFGATGTVQEKGKRERKYHYQIFGSEEIENQGCHAVEMSKSKNELKLSGVIVKYRIVFLFREDW